MTTSAAAFNDRITSLTPRLNRIARSLVGSLSEYTAEDIFQEIVLKMLERVSDDPEFAGRPDNELLVFAQWRGRHLTEKGRNYTKYVEAEKFQQDDRGDEISAFEFISGDDPTPEEAVISLEALEAIEQFAAGLDPNNRQVMEMTIQGYGPSEIAACMGVSKGRVGQRKAEIISQLARLQ